MIRNSMRLVGWAHRKAVCAGLRHVYSASTEQAGKAALGTFDAKYKHAVAAGIAWRFRAF